METASTVMVKTDLEQPRVSLSFLSGQCQGSEYVMDDPAEVFVGRTAEAELVLLDGLVSRRHARITLEGGELSIEDLGSTNGTFVNGERVQHRDLEEGDRILIGTSIIRIAWTSAPPTENPPTPVPRSVRSLQDGHWDDEGQITGRLVELPLAELLEVLATTKRSVRLLLRRGSARGQIFVREGSVLEARVNGLDDATPRKCIERLLGWSDGDYALKRYEEPPGGGRLDVPIPQLLAEALFNVDEFNVLRSTLGGPDVELVLSRPLAPALRDLTGPELELLQMAHNFGDVDRILDTLGDTDMELAQRLLSLLDRGYLHRA